MQIETSKIQLVKTILDSEDEEFISRLVDFVRSETDDFWPELTSKQQEDIKKGIAQLDQGKRKPYRQVIDRLGK
jgi:hypothetical protein